MRNLLFIIGQLHLVGGEERSVSLLCNELANRGGYNITIVSLSGEYAEYPLDDTIHVIHLQLLADSKIKRLMRLVETIRQSDFHLIVAYGTGARLMPDVLPFFVKTPIVFCEREDPVSYRNRSLKNKIKKALCVHSLRHKIIVFQTSSFIRHYKRLKKAAVIPNMLDVSRMPDVNDWLRRDNKVINASRCDPTKNHALLIKAFVAVHDLHPQYTLEIHSEGKLKPEYLELIKQLGAESYIKILPPGKKIFDHMNNAKIYVCSSDAEGYPNSLLEAMAMGMACISTKCNGCIEDLIEDGVNGLMVPIDDVDSMAKALIKLMESDIMAQGLASRAIDVRVSNAKEMTIGKWVSFFEEVMSEK